MKPLTLAVSALLFSLVSGVLADDRLEGVYERVSLVNTRTGESPEAANRQGILILADGHYAMLTQNPDREYLSDEDVRELTAEAEVAYLRQWLDINAHAGRYEADDGTLTWYRDISENPREVGTTAELGYEWREGLLVIHFTLPNGDRYDWSWRRL